MTYQTEFPDFAAATLPPLPPGFEDVSWHNDACPSFAYLDRGLTVYVDFADPALREHEGCERFQVIVTSERDIPQLGETLLATDDWSEVQNLIANAGAQGAAMFRALTAEFAAWIEAHPGRAEMGGDALEHLMFAENTPEESRWLKAFCDRWDAAELVPGFYS